VSWLGQLKSLICQKLSQKYNEKTCHHNGFVDTYAHLLYKLNRRKEAIEWMTKAIEAHKAMGQPVRSFEVTKEQMETGRL
jgi:hypothetical protein